MKAGLLAISFDCGDAAKLADFWAAAFGRSVAAGATAESARIAIGDPDQAPQPTSVGCRTSGLAS